MISSLVSSILTPASATAAEKTAAQQLEQDRSRPAMATVIEARPVTARPIDPIVDQGGASADTDYFHAAKHMLGQAFGDFRRDLKDAFGGLGFEDGVAGEMTKAVAKQTKNALLWGVGFSVKLMTATVSQTTPAAGSAGVSSFSVSARSLEIRVNHATGVIDVDAGTATIESQNSGAWSAEQPHLLDISDSDTAPGRSLASALQALERPDALFEDEEDAATGHGAEKTISAAAVAVTSEEPAFKGVLPSIDRPTVITRPEYRARIMVSSMEHLLNVRGEQISRLRLDAVIPLTGHDRTPRSVPT